MPVLTVERVAKKCETLEKKLAGQGEKLDAARRRGLRKKIKRAQRKQQRLVVAAARSAKAEPKAKAEAPAAPADDANKAE